MPRTKVVIEVLGGVVTCVSKPDDGIEVEVEIIDYDNLEAAGKDAPEMNHSYITIA